MLSRKAPSASTVRDFVSAPMAIETLRRSSSGFRWRMVCERLASERDSPISCCRSASAFASRARRAASSASRFCSAASAFARRGGASLAALGALPGPRAPRLA